MRKYENIQVLWVEDDPKITEAYPREAEMFEELELHPFPCWEDAEAELERDYDRWDAILLDAKCRYRKNDADKAEKFLSHVFPRIQSLANRKGRVLPWYVLSGQGEDDIRDLIPDVNDWDADWEKLVNRRFYSKNGKVILGNKEEHERRFLFHRIRTQVIRYDHDLQIEKNLYADVFKSLDNLELATLTTEVGGSLMLLLEPIHFQGTSNDDYNRRYVELRKALEHIFRLLVSKGVLPPNIVAKNKKDSVNLSWSSLFLGSKQPENLEKVEGGERSFWGEVKRNTNSPLLPRQLAGWLQAAVFQTGGAVHTSTKKGEDSISLEKYLPQVGNSPYMLRSLSLGLCDFILWCDNFLKENPNEETNARNFWTLTREKF
ncbi:hypothetical protein M2480_002442 [Parabacteroides sp. PFB2-12]|uniref:hypothetical protein n=1 Tax=unclassified Parabacteroides TaxID=2649774 RepID=UPI0024747457|nr:MULTISPECIES: hypothetical protein [unclassified Parabacteroides]MDH6343572.1 hypothetical protein [Parabacteroides sp. PM6-13]MDH6391447.1 hypothetical protein [Parabacteroides sp. PFB2-12]